jgi:hypothetical protein
VDVDIALGIDRYDFAVRVGFEDGRPVARMEKPVFTTTRSPSIRSSERHEARAIDQVGITNGLSGEA